MKLSLHLSERGSTIARAAGETGIHPETFRQYVIGGRIPGRDNMATLYVWSRGAVQPNDFFDLPELTEEQAA